jgi:hypothetical protein
MDQGQIPERDFVEFDDWESLLAFLQEFRVAEHDYKSIVFDVLDGFVGLAKKWALVNRFDNDDGPKGWLNYSAGERFIASTMWPELHWRRCKAFRSSYSGSSTNLSNYSGWLGIGCKVRWLNGKIFKIVPFGSRRLKLSKS